MQQKKRRQKFRLFLRQPATRLAAALSQVLRDQAGNVTGLSIQAAETSGKRIELLREALHALSRLAIMGNGNNSAVAVEMRET